MRGGSRPRASGWRSLCDCISLTQTGWVVPRGVFSPVQAGAAGIMAAPPRGTGARTWHNVRRSVRAASTGVLAPLRGGHVCAIATWVRTKGYQPHESSRKVRGRFWRSTWPGLRVDHGGLPPMRPSPRDVLAMPRGSQSPHPRRQRPAGRTRRQHSPSPHPRA